MSNDVNIASLHTELGNRIRSHRKSQDLSQVKLSMMANIDRSYLIGIEQGKRNVSLDVLARLCSSLDVKLSELFKDID